MKIEKNIKPAPKAPSKLLALLAASIVICLLLIGFLMLSSRGYFARKEDPMMKEDVDYLCQQLEIKDPICGNSQAVYPKDFTIFISERFENSSSSYQDFQNVFSQFQTKLTIYEDPDVIVGVYDINRDGTWDLMPYFDGTLIDNTVRFVVFKESLG